MASVTRTRTVDDDGLAELRQARTDLVREVPDGQDRWAMADGPFKRYQRSLSVDSGAEGHEVTEITEYALAVPVWSPLVRPLMSRALASTDRTPRRRWWWPREVVSPAASNLVATLCVISVMTGYLGVLIGQTITFAAADFGAGDGVEANTLAAVRVGVLLSLVIIHRADRIGRRPLILGFATTAIVFAMLGALAQNMLMLGLAQTISRGLTTGLITLLVLASTEEVPAGFRAFTISLLAICTALGAGMVVWFLPLNDLIQGGWRIVYLIPGVFLVPLWWISRYLPETRRFAAAVSEEAPAEVNWARFALVGGAAFASALFLSPASQLRNEFLRDDLSYSATTISLFQLVISAPAGLAIILAGLAADRVGRRWIGAIGVSVGAIMIALSFQFTGAGLWLAASVGIVFTAMATPALRGYGVELFPTRSRARVGGMLDVVGVAGSAVGLLAVGYLAERWDDLGSAIGVFVFAPLLVGVAIIAFFPETAATELEHFNPSDPELDAGSGSQSELGSGGEPDRSNGSGSEQDPAGLGEVGDPRRSTG